MMSTQERWLQGVEPEVRFWRHWLHTGGDRWPDEYRYRTDPDAEVEPGLFAFLGEPRVVRVLDVGSGPLTSVGKVWKGHRIELHACDALADEYRRIPYPPGLPLVDVTAVRSEALSSAFDEGTFDLVFARNTLDHGLDPLTALREMILVAKGGGLIVTEHWPFEGTNEGWSGFHQWDFFVEDRQWMMRDRTGSTTSITREVQDVVAQIHISEATSCFVVFKKG